MGQRDELFWQLIERVHPRALSYAEHLAGNSSDGGDLYQDAVVKAYEGFDKLRQAESFDPWFYRIISNAFRERFRNPWWRRVMSSLVDLDKADIPINPVQILDARRRLDYAMSALSPDDRIIVTLAELDGWSIAEIAAMQGRTEGSVKMRLMRAREKMRVKLGARILKSPETDVRMEGQKGYELSSGATEAE
jgi:RNA polymerase sigma-70 factor, ECF subfamily